MSTLTCPICGETKPWEGNSSGLILIEAEPPNSMVCRSCEDVGQMRNQQWMESLPGLRSRVVNNERFIEYFVERIIELKREIAEWRARIAELEGE